ncbi:Type 3 secretion system secretin [Dissostichus eleginoides]|uniref:Type 3 secretion system secretin n=1 Tax=Dissostichus eleginoides TaxID=100907 RepID=A0AAD9CH41_DISEL|nr:Type 3 secretion system secretin [Dissostichus eleginoides]
MAGLLYITLTALLASCDAFRVGSSQRIIPLSAPGARVFQDEGPAQAHFIQELVRTKRHTVPDLVRVQPHLVHDMGHPEIHETSRSQDKMESDNSSQINPPPPAGQEAVRTRPALEENVGVVDEMERMVHLVVPQDAEGYRGSQTPATQTRSSLAGQSC